MLLPLRMLPTSLVVRLREDRLFSEGLGVCPREFVVTDMAPKVAPEAVLDERDNGERSFANDDVERVCRAEGEYSDLERERVPSESVDCRLDKSMVDNRRVSALGASSSSLNEIAEQLLARWLIAQHEAPCGMGERGTQTHLSLQPRPVVRPTPSRNKRPFRWRLRRR